ncbi:RhoGEF domain-containing protein gxcJ [Folsomia candida]|uniref:RhoGEF domain-containing protein gxcJ n=1 Tax=Folsomia candida TaxID=158441 RepID=A0A226F5U1_FOLCA|nr:RhoGEF domain-containing protein gxcJ [Folsomia candida]
MRIAGQKMYMPPNKGVTQPSSAISSSFSNGKCNGENRMNGAGKNLNKRIAVRQGSLSSGDEWSDEMEQQSLIMNKNKHVPMSRDRNLQQFPDKANKDLIINSSSNGDRRNPKTGQNNNNKAQQQQQQQQNHQQRRGGNQIGTRTSLDNGIYNNHHQESNDCQSNININNDSMIVNSDKTVRSNHSLLFTNTSTSNYDNQCQTQRDCDDEENYQVEFEEFAFEDSVKSSDSTMESKQAKAHLTKSGDDLASKYVNGMGGRYDNMTSKEKQRTFIKNGQNANKRSPTCVSTQVTTEVSHATLESNYSNTNKPNNHPSKFSALRRRKSRNGSNNPGKLLREVIYEEEMEHDHITPKEVSTSNVPSISATSKSNKNYAVKIVVPGTVTEYVKPILKNRERIYDAPMNGGSNENNKDHYASTNYGANDGIYFDSSVSTTSTLKKKVQFDQDRVIVCGGDSGPDSDDCGIDEGQDYYDHNQEKSVEDEGGDYDNEETTSCPNNNDETSGVCNQRNGEIPNQKQHQSNKESGSVGLKSNLSRKSALSDSHDNSSQNQSSAEIRQKTKSTFEQEVARKAASFARSRKLAEEVEANKLHNNNPTADTTAVVVSNNEECFDQVNNLGSQALDEDQSRFTSTNNPAFSSSSTSLTNRKSSLKSNWKSPVINLSTASQGTTTTTIPDPTQQILPKSRDITIAKERIFVKNSKAASHGVASQIMKAKRIPPGGKLSPANDAPYQPEKIINPNSLLFNDTTRIRLNQSRPSLNETFQLNLSTNGNTSGTLTSGSSSSTGGRGIRLKQSSSFRTLGSSPLRPREPPPPPPPTASATLNTKQTINTKSSSTSSKRLQMNISSSISGQLDKLLTKSSSTNQIYGSNLSLNGNRLHLSKSLISLPMDLQTTSNQASRVIKNQNTHGQKANASPISNHNNSNKGSGFEANGTKTSTRASLKSNVDCKKIDGNSNSGRSKSLTDRCEALDKMLGNNTAGTNTALNNSASSANKNANNSRSNLLHNKSEEIVQTNLSQGKRGNLKSSSSVANAAKPKSALAKSSEIAKSMNGHRSSSSQAADCQNDEHNIEIVTKENAVSEIRIYSVGTSAIVIPTGNGMAANNEPPTGRDSQLGGKGEVSKQEMHYAATDICSQQRNNANSAQFLRQPPPPLPPISQDARISTQPTRPQSTSVVLIVDSSKQNNGLGNGSKVTEQSSPLTYSQPIDSLSRNNMPSNYPPLPLQRESHSALPTSNPYDSNPNADDEPMYDDVIHHQQHHNSTADKPNSNHNLNSNNNGSLGRKFLMASLSSMNPIRKQVQDNSAEKHVPVITTGHVVSSTLPCMACPPSLPPPNLPSKNLSEFTNRPVIIKEDEGGQPRGSFGEMTNDQSLDEEVDNLYNDISEGATSRGAKSLQSFASSMKGALLNAIKNMDFDRRSVISSGNASNHSGGSQNHNNVKYDCNDAGEGESCNLDNFIYDDTLSLRSENSDTKSSIHKSFGSSHFKSSFDSFSLKSSNTSHFPPPPSSIRSNSSTIKQLSNLEEQDETDTDPLYDDVISYSLVKSKNGVVIDTSHSSDSGAESEDAIPPPLPAQGPPKISTELPLLTFPLLLNRSNNSTLNSTNNNSSSLNAEKISGDILSPSSQQKSYQSLITGAGSVKADVDAVIRTRSLLSELNEKLSQLNSLAEETTASSIGSNAGDKNRLEFSTYSPTKNNVSSSSSSGVEEDYNSEKNYSFSNSSDGASGSSSSAEENYKLAQVTKLVAENITMARGKFLDSMKTNSLQSNLNSPANLKNAMLSSNGTSRPVSRDSGSSPSASGPPMDEPIYEEIGDINRSHSPIYADAFDAKRIFDGGASKNEILSFLESIRDRLTSDSNSSNGSQSSSVSSKKGQDSNYLVEENLSSSIVIGEICHLPTHAEEDSEEIVTQNKLVLRKICPDCYCNDVPVDDKDEEERITIEDDKISQSLCPSCNRKRSERKEIITEIYETEMKYGRDLQIILEEFYKPIQIAGLLNKEQLDQIFLNTGELSEISSQLTMLLKAEITSAIVERKDEDLASVNIGKIFLDIGEKMMMAFQTYCTRQTIVQRVTRYPLLLSRLLKATPLDHFSRDDLQSAHEKIEYHLEHMNKATREVSSVKLWRRISIINGNSTPLPRRSNNDLEGASVSIKKMSIDVLDWTSLTDITCVIDNQLGVFQFNGKPLRGIYACLLVRGKDMEALSCKMDNEMFFPPAEDIVKEVKLVLVRVKNTRFCLLREPLCLANCVVSQGENEFQDFVEINEITSKNTYHLQGIDKQATSAWLKYLQCYSLCVGQWRRRRGALANIMMNGMLKNL